MFTLLYMYTTPYLSTLFIYTGIPFLLNIHSLGDNWTGKRRYRGSTQVWNCSYSKVGIMVGPLSTRYSCRWTFHTDRPSVGGIRDHTTCSYTISTVRLQVYKSARDHSHWHHENMWTMCISTSMRQNEYCVLMAAVWKLLQYSSCSWQINWIDNCATTTVDILKV